jgi:hypothetical protein
MAKAVTTVRLTAHVRWWAWLYLHGMATMAHATGLEPNWDKVAAWLTRGIVVRVDPVAPELPAIPCGDHWL